MTQTQSELIEKNIKLVYFAANKIVKTFPFFVELDDLISYGFFGLIRAAKYYKSELGTFTNYATKVIIFEIYDQYRRESIITRTRYKNIKSIENFINDFYKKNGREPKKIELESFKEHQKINEEFESFDVLQPVFPENYTKKETKINFDFFNDLFNGNLKNQERAILILYFFEDMTQKEIGKNLNLSESRVCQILNHLYSRVRAKHKKERSCYDI